MLYFSIIVYTAFGLMCLWFIISGVRKIDQEKHNQQAAADQKDLEKQQEQEQKQESEQNEESLSD